MSGLPGDLVEAVAEWQTARLDLAIAKAVRRLLTEGGAKTAGWCLPGDKLTIQQDAELTAFLRSVAKANAWAEERDRIRSKRKKERRLPDHARLPGAHPMPLPTIIRCLPMWRSWGRLLIEAERAPPTVCAPPSSSARASGGTSSSGTRAKRNDSPDEDVSGGPGIKGP